MLTPVLKYLAICFWSQQVHVWPQQLSKSWVMLVTKMKSNGHVDGWLDSKAQENPVSSCRWTLGWYLCLGESFPRTAKLSSDHSDALFHHQDENIVIIKYFKWIVNIK